MSERVEATVIGGTRHGEILMVERAAAAHLFPKGGTLASFVDPLRRGEPLPKEEYVLRAAAGYDGGYVLLPASDGDLLQAYQRTSGSPGDREADALLAEIGRRNLDV